MRGDGAGQDCGRVVDRPLERVGLLAPCQLEDGRADVVRGRRLERDARHVERLGADVDRRHGEARNLAAGTRQVQLMDARRPRAQRLGRLPHDPLGGLGSRRVVGERGRPREVADAVGAEAGRIDDLDRTVVDVDDPRESGQEVADGRFDVGHDQMVSPVPVPSPRPPRLRRSA